MSSNNHVKEKSSSSSSLITICLQFGSRRNRLQINTATTVVDLYQRAAEELGEQSSQLQLKPGFPPRPLERDSTKTLAECGICHQDRILADVVVVNEETTTATTTKTPRKSKRKAAQAATAAFPEVIAQQDQAIAAAAQQKRKKGRTTKTTGASPSSKPKSSSPVAVSRHFASLNSTTGAAFRLRDGQQQQKKRPPKKKTTGFSSFAKQTQDATTNPVSLEEGLVASATSSSGLRGRWRDAVASAYEQNQAAARTAALSNDCVFEPSSVGTTASLRVTYPKGIQGRGNFCDTVPLLPLDALSAAMQSVTQKEGLRHMALLSPRVYWSLRYHTECQTVQECLEAVAPDEDWSFLRRRPRKQSAKARENSRQQQALGDENEADWEAAAEAIAAVEDAMGGVATANASTEDHSPGALPTATWSVTTPDEEDLDELKQCIQEKINDDEDPDDLARSLLDKGVHNWRQLANCDPEDDGIPTEWIDYAQAQSLEEIMVELCDGDGDAVATLRDKANSGTPHDLALWRRVVSTLQMQVPTYTVVQLQCWCDRAASVLEQLPWLGEFQTPI